MSVESNVDQVSSVELTLLRSVLLFCLHVPRQDALAEIADLAGLSTSAASAAAESLIRAGIIRRIDWDGLFTLSPNLEHTSVPSLAAKASAVPLCWARVRSSARDPHEIRANIDDHEGLWGDVRGEGAERFEHLEHDARRAAALLRVGVSGFSSALYWGSDLVDAAYLFEPSAWRSAAACFADGSLRRRIGLSLAEDRVYPGLPPMLIVDRQRMNCSMCLAPAAPSEGRHVTAIDGQIGSGLWTSTISPPALPGDPFEPGCGVVWTHYTIRAWLAEIAGWVGPQGQVLERMDPLGELPDLIWLDP